MSEKTYRSLVQSRVSNKELQRKKLKDYRKQLYETNRIRNNIRKALNRVKNKIFH